MKIEVTQEDIDKGKRRQACNCPISLAVKRHTGARYVATFPLSGLNFIENDKTYILPAEEDQESFTTFVCDFDDGNPVEPFTFELPL
jgi:hypothetical protein